MSKIRSLLVFLPIVLLMMSTSASANKKADAQAIVDKATVVVQGFSNDPDLGWFREKVKEAKAVLIIPQSLKGAFIVGGSGGTGVLLSHNAGSAEWGYPAFYSVGSISVGMQIGAEASEVILMIMTDRGMEKLLTSSFKLGADVVFAAGPVGGGKSANTADVLSYSRAKGAFVGVSLDGAVVKTRDKLNEAYYAKKVSPTDILIRKTVTNPDADTLRQEVSKTTAK